jgi:1-deoxy-D-xylulose-5-phosphate reductoisomerase
MRTPIAHALTYPERIEAGVASLDLFEIAQLRFERPDLQRFPCLGLAYRALAAGGNAPAVLNAANEVAVESFLEGRLPFLKIADVIAAALDAVPTGAADDLDAVLGADAAGRAAARRALAAYHR